MVLCASDNLLDDEKQDVNCLKLQQGADADPSAREKAQLGGFASSILARTKEDRNSDYCI